MPEETIDFGDALKHLDDKFAEAEAGSNERTLLPEGEYILRCVDAQSKLRNKDKAPLLIFTFKVVDDGPEQGKDFDLIRNLTNEKTFGFLKQEVEVLNIAYSSLSTLPYEVEQAINQCVKARIAHNEYQGKTYMNVYLNESVNDPDKIDLDGITGQGDDSDSDSDDSDALKDKLGF